MIEKFPELKKLSAEEMQILLSELYEEVYPASSPDPQIVAILEKRWQEHTEDESGAATLEQFRSRLGLS